MLKNITELIPVRCVICNGSGRVENKLCAVCHGLGNGLICGDVVYYFSLPVTRGSIFLRRMRERIYSFLDFLLIVIGLSGAFALAWWLYKISNTNLDFQNIVEGKDPLVLWFWLTGFLDLFIVFRLYVREQEVIKIKQTATNAVLDETRDWNSISGKKLKNAADCLSMELLNSLEKAYVWVGDLGQSKVTPLHFWFVMLGESIQAKHWLSRLTFEPQVLATKLRHQVELLGMSSGAINFAPGFDRIILQGLASALREGRQQIEVVDLWLPAMEADPVLSEVLYDSGIEQNKLSNLTQWFNTQERLKINYKSFRHAARFKPGNTMDRAYTALATPLVDSLAEDLTVSAKYGRLPLCVGRETELETVLTAMASGQAGLLLVGPPGVGKRTIVGGLAQLMVLEQVPLEFRDKRLLTVDAARLLGGLAPEAAEQQLIRLIDEVATAGNCIIHLPNLEELLGLTAGGASSLDAAGILADALDRRLLFCVATVSEENYRRFVEGSALARLLMMIPIEEPEANKAICMLESKVSFLENHYKVFINYEAIAEAVRLTAKLEHSEYLPAKALVILEKTVAGVAHERGFKTTVTGEDVAVLVSRDLKVPVSQVNHEEGQALLALENKMHERIVGQTEAVSMVAESLRRARAELRDNKRPIATFLFLGPTGVGKTELAKVLADNYFGSESAMIRLDMSEYQGEDAVIKMIGTPNGSKGYLTEKVRQAPFALVLLDELEKANPGVFDLFLQVIDDGRLTDGQGNTVDFTNTIIIATSNIGSLAIKQAVESGQDLTALKQQLIDQELMKVMRPELVNRFDGVVLFKPLAITEVIAITKLLIDQLGKLLANKGMRLSVDKKGLAILAAKGYHPEFGARPLRRLLQDQIENVIANKILSGELARRDLVAINEAGEVVVEKAKSL